MKELSFKKILSMILAAVTVLAAIPFVATPVNVNAAATSGTTGDCTWSLDGTVLTISGNGAMGDYDSSSTLPWGTSITKVIVEDGVTSIGDWAFFNCTSLTSIDLSGCTSLESVGTAAFTRTVYYNDSTNWENGVLYINSILVEAKTTIEGAYSVKKGTVVIADDAFFGCKKLTSIDLSGCTSLKNISYDAFYYCSGLTSIDLSGCTSLESIGSHSFYYCSGLTSIDFTGCTSLKSIDSFAFSNCTKLTSIDLSECLSLERLDAGAFYNTAYYNDDANWENGVLYINSVLIDADNTIIKGEYSVKEGTTVIANSAFSGCTELTSIDLSKCTSLESTGDSVFTNCRKLKSIDLSNCTSLESIGRYAFSDCIGLTSIVIPSSVTNIGHGASNDCFSLEDIWYTGTEEDWKSISIGQENNYLNYADKHYETKLISVSDKDCTKETVKTFECKDGHRLEITTPAIGEHTPGPEATCTNPQTCTICGKVLAEAHHTPGSEATCAEDQVCAVCGDVLIEAHHTPCSEATCTEDQVCTVCGEVLVEAPGHTPGTPATCTEPQVCTVCGEVLAEALGHTPGTPATCTEPQVCTVCGEVLAEALGHTPGTPATCTEPQVCTVCGEVLAEALGHTPGTPAACTEPQVCTVCGEVLVEALGHIPGPDATCTEDQVCTVCGEVLVEAPGHTPGTPATCTEDQICTVCGEVLEEAFGHTPCNAWEHNEAEHWLNCAVCGDTVENASAHIPGAPATCTNPQKCTVCGEELALPLGHNYVDGYCTRCGQYENAGDIDDDSLVASVDSNLLRRIIVGLLKVLEGTDMFLAADINGDGEINSVDSNLLRRMIAGA